MFQLTCWWKSLTARCVGSMMCKQQALTVFQFLMSHKVCVPACTCMSTTYMTRTRVEQLRKKCVEKIENHSPPYNLSISVRCFVFSGLYTSRTPVASFQIAGQQLSNLILNVCGLYKYICLEKGAHFFQACTMHIQIVHYRESVSVHVLYVLLPVHRIQWNLRIKGTLGTT